MKKLSKFFIVVLVLMTLLSVTSINAFAATVKQDDLEVTLETDKNEYGEYEQIAAKLTVKNQNSFAVKHVDLTTVIPEGFGVTDNSGYSTSVDSIGSGESVALNTVLKKGAAAPGGTDAPEESKSSDHTVQIIVIVSIFVAIVALLVVICVLLIKKKKDAANKIVSLLLCACLSGLSAFALRSNADAVETVGATAARSTASVSVSVKVGGADIMIIGKAEYDSVGASAAGVSLEDFKADKFDVYVGTREELVFTVNVRGSQESDLAVGVYGENDALVCNMNDKGVDGDMTAGDNIYSGVATVSSSDVKTVEYYAKHYSLKSEPFEVCFYRDLTQDELGSFTKLMNKVSPMTYDEANSFIKTSDEVVSYEIDDDNKIITFKSKYGISGIWDNAARGGTGDSRIKGTGEYAFSDPYTVSYTEAKRQVGELQFTPAHSNHNVVAVRPFRGTEFRYDDFKDAAETVASALGGRATVFDDENVTLDVMKSLSQYGTVLIDSHGTLKSQKTPYMLIGETLDEDKFLWDVGYYLTHIGYSADYLSGRIYCTGYYNRLAVGGKFFKKYYPSGSLNDSVWYLGTCYSMHDDSIANALTEKGASMVYGFSEPVSVGYCNECLFEIFVNSFILSADTAGSAFSEAKRIFGSVDHYDSAPPYCELKKAGDDAFKLVSELKSGNEGTLSGKVCKASDRVTAIPNASITIYENNRILRSLTSDATGNYSVSLDEGEYYFEIKAAGYIDFHSYATVIKNEETFVETFLMIDGSEDQKGIAAGQIVNSLNDEPVEGVSLTIRKDWNNANSGAQTVATASTDSGGRYSVELPLGNYTVVLTKNGYLEHSFNIIVQNGTTDNQNSTITPVVSGDEFLITLTWDEDPRDLDAHVEGTLSDGRHFHVYYNDMNCSDGSVQVCSLDYDDRYSYGPEHITLKTTTEHPYYFYVFRYAGEGTVASSGAKVTVHQGNQLVRTYNVPTNLGSDDYWNVFAIKGGVIINRNTITDRAETSYAD